MRVIKVEGYIEYGDTLDMKSGLLVGFSTILLFPILYGV